MDGTDGVHALTGGILELPVLVALAGEDRAAVTAAHVDDHVRVPHCLGGQHLGVLCGNIDALFRHYHQGNETVPTVVTADGHFVAKGAETYDRAKAIIGRATPVD